MLDPDQLIEVPDDLGCQVYADDRDVAGFYVVPQVARIACGDGGQAELELTIHGRRGPRGFEATGALLTLTTELAVPAAHLGRVEALLRQRLAAGTPSDATGSPLRPTLLSLDWLDATVHVTLVQGIELSGTPSLSGSNRCSFSTSFDRATAATLCDAWGEGLPDGVISYQGHLRTRPGGTGSTVHSASATVTIDTQDGVRVAQWASHGAQATGGLDAHGEPPKPFAVSATGPIGGSGCDFSSAVTRIELG